MGDGYFLREGYFFYPISTFNRMYIAFLIRNLAPQITQSKIRSYENGCYWLRHKNR